jgi:hypothetical protein
VKRVLPELKRLPESLDSSVRATGATLYATDDDYCSGFDNKRSPPWSGEWKNGFNDTFENRISDK